jgi:hypothetical protein
VVPDTNTYSPSTTAREYPIFNSNSDPLEMYFLLNLLSLMHNAQLSGAALLHPATKGSVLKPLVITAVQKLHAVV